MNDSELSSLIAGEIASAQSMLSGELAEERRQALKYYLSEPFGDEKEGRSQVVSSDVMDTIEWILPSLLKIFTAGDDTVVFEPTEPNDEAIAKQATQYVNWIFNRDNPGFLVLYSIFKDALLEKNGFAKVWWDERESDETLTVRGADPDTFALAAADTEIEITGQTENEDGTTDYTYKRKKDGRVCIESVPPEEFLIERRARCIADSRFTAHRVRKTISDLIAEGYPRELVEDLPGDDDTDVTEESIVRRQFDQEPGPDPEREGPMRQVWVYECYIRVDLDEDGLAEMWQVVVAGGDRRVLSKEEWGGPPPFVSITPIIMPHRFYGLSVADLVMDVQLIKSTILRQILDNLYLSNNGRHVVSDKVNLDDMLVSRPGGIVRMLDGAMPGQGHVFPLETPLVAAQAFPMLEYLDSIRENRTGVTRYNQGVDADSLNKTATGINQIMTAAQQRIELIARVFAETGVKDLFRLILRCISQYQQKPRMIRLRNEWVPMDPRQWEHEFDLSVNVGIGSGNKDMLTLQLQQLLAIQVQAITMQGGANGPLVTLDNVFKVGKKLQESLGFKEENFAFTDPSASPPQPPKPDPEMLKLQQKDKIDTGRLQLDTEKARADVSLKAAELRMKGQETNASLAMQAHDGEQQRMLDREKHDADIGVKREQAAASAKPPVSLSLNGKEVGEMATGLSQVIQQIAEQQAAFMQRQAERDAKQDQMMAAILMQSNQPKQITGALPSGQQFTATINAPGNA